MAFGKPPNFMDGLTGKVLSKKIRSGSAGRFAQHYRSERWRFFCSKPQGMTLNVKTDIQTFAAPKADKTGKMFIENAYTVYPVSA